MHNAVLRRAAQLEEAGRSVIATDPAGIVVYWGEGAEQLYGWTSAEAIGRDIIQLTPGDLSRDEAAAIMEALQAGRPWSGEFLVVAKSGSRFTVHVTDMPVVDDDGVLLGIVGISRRVGYISPAGAP